jgi:hypothetical protein
MIAPPSEAGVQKREIMVDSRFRTPPDPAHFTA